jgi:hypothetical protein
MCAPRLLSIAALAIAVPALAATPRQVMTSQEVREYRAVSQFMRAVDQYVLTHRIVEPLPHDAMCLPETTVSSVNELAATPLAVRGVPREGDIFALDVADLFRDRIANAIRHHGINGWDLVSEMNEDEMVAPPAVVGEALPWGVGDRTITWLSSALPMLPDGIEYRLAGRDLVLFDLKDNIVVDALRVAVPMY